MANENLTWGYTRIRGGLKHLGHDVARNTINAILKDHGIPRSHRTRQHVVRSATFPVVCGNLAHITASRPRFLPPIQRSIQPARDADRPRGERPCVMLRHPRREAVTQQFQKRVGVAALCHDLEQLRDDILPISVDPAGGLHGHVDESCSCAGFREGLPGFLGPTGFPEGPCDCHEPLPRIHRHLRQRSSRTLQFTEARLGGDELDHCYDCCGMP